MTEVEITKKLIKERNITSDPFELGNAIDAITNMHWTAIPTGLGYVAHFYENGVSKIARINLTDTLPRSDVGTLLPLLREAIEKAETVFV